MKQYPFYCGKKKISSSSLPVLALAAFDTLSLGVSMFLPQDCGLYAGRNKATEAAWPL